MSPEAQKELNRLEDAPVSAAEWKRRALAAEKRVRELEAQLATKDKVNQAQELTNFIRNAVGE